MPLPTWIPGPLLWPYVALVGMASGRDPVSGQRISCRYPCRKIGSGYGGWTVPVQLMREGAICYTAGVGEDITFDLGLIEQFGCAIYAIDPTPRAAAHVARHAAHEPRFHFLPVGLWDVDEKRRFYAPSNPAHVSHSTVNLQKTEVFFEAECKRLATLMREQGHQTIDLLKLDIEGAEYQVLDSLHADGIAPRVLCVEFDEAYHPLDGDFARRIRAQVARIVDRGYDVAAIETRCNYTFVRRE